MEFDTLLSLTPKLYDLGVVNALSSPNDFAPVQHNGLWYFFVTNQLTGALSRVEMGASLATAAPSLAYLNADFAQLKNPTGIAIIRDCDSFHMFLTDRQTKDFIRLDVLDITGPATGYTINNFGALGSISDPTGMSRAIRDHDNIFMFTTNVIDSVLTRIKFQQCSNASIQSSTTMKPPVYKYNAAGIYNLYYLADEGLPTMKVQCKLIYVLPTPPIVMSADTFMCAGDSMKLKVLSINAINKTWSPAYNISSTTLDNVIVWPKYSTTYRILLPYSSGCVVDTAIRVHVTKVMADAGPDRTVQDGASTQLGGPFTSLGTNYSYTWTPKRYIVDDMSLTPVVNPPNDYTYYLEVKEANTGCKNVDTVVVRVECNDVNMPNAFKPQGSDYQSRFGIANNQIVKLVHFRIFDRWGREVFSTTDPTKQWDGKINGEYAEMGVYAYFIDGFCTSGKRVTKKGNVTLIR
jgi:gliding motility-associated-like protein